MDATEPGSQGKTKKAEKINGLLYLPALGLILTMLLSVLDLYGFGAMIADYYFRSHILSGYSAGALVMLILHLAIAVCAAMFFFRKKRKTRNVMVVYYLFGLLHALYFLSFPVLPFVVCAFALPSGRIALFALVGVVIWLPYFLFSKRVARVFSVA